MMDLPEARETIADILERRDSDRSVELWRSDIMRMTDMMLWVYNVWAKPMTYDKGNLLEFDNFPHSNVRGSNLIDSIEKIETGYVVTVNGSPRDLKDISDPSILRPLLGLLLFKEFCNWDCYCDGC